jgi:BASS family bile acid:Na+ symporter
MPVVFISFAATFLLGWVIELSARILRLSRDTTVSIVLLGTLKNYGLSGGLALSFFDQRAAIPSTVSVVFMILYIIWLDFRYQGTKRGQVSEKASN